MTLVFYGDKRSRTVRFGRWLTWIFTKNRRPKRFLFESHAHWCRRVNAFYGDEVEPAWILVDAQDGTPGQIYLTSLTEEK